MANKVMADGPRVVPFRLERKATLDTLRWAKKRLTIPILLEVDVAVLVERELDREEIRIGGVVAHRSHEGPFRAEDTGPPEGLIPYQDGIGRAQVQVSWREQLTRAIPRRSQDRSGTASAGPLRIRSPIQCVG